MLLRSEERIESDLLVDLPIQTARPEEKAQEFPARAPDKTHDLSRSQGFSFLTGIRLYPPPQVLAPPGSEAMAARRIPDKTNRSEQDVFLRFEYRRTGYSLIDFKVGYCSLLKRLLDCESSCEITSSRAVCCVSESESWVDTVATSACIRLRGG